MNLCITNLIVSSVLIVTSLPGAADHPLEQHCELTLALAGKRDLSVCSLFFTLRGSKAEWRLEQGQYFTDFVTYESRGGGQLRPRAFLKLRKQFGQVCWDSDFKASSISDPPDFDSSHINPLCLFSDERGWRAARWSAVQKEFRLRQLVWDCLAVADTPHLRQLQASLRVSGPSSADLCRLVEQILRGRR